MDSLNSLLRNLPQVDAVLVAPELADTLNRYRRSIVKRLVQDEIAALRERIQSGAKGDPADVAMVCRAVAAQVARLDQPGLKRVVNATGIVLHTNLGRAVLSAEARQAINEVASAYNNLEFELASGERGKRDAHLAPLLELLTGCDAATVVNNNAAAVFLTLNELAAGRDVITSRGELVEIGGSFRVPDIVRASGCNLVEVGSTNRTRLSDYEHALSACAKPPLLLKTHPSNFRIQGFTEETSIEDLAGLAARHPGVEFYVDLGSGYLAGEGGARLPEPDIQAVLNAGPDIVSFSGDKLLGGPQAGIIIGRTGPVARIRRNPLWRAMRIDKFTAAALEATLRGYLAQEPPALSPVAIAARQPSELRCAADDLAEQLRKACPQGRFDTVVASGSYGGGSLPEQAIPSYAVSVELPGLAADALAAQLRRGDPPVVGYAHQGLLLLNLLTLLDGDSTRIVECFKEFDR